MFAENGRTSSLDTCGECDEDMLESCLDFDDDGVVECGCAPPFVRNETTGECQCAVGYDIRYDGGSRDGGSYRDFCVSICELYA